MTSRRHRPQGLTLSGQRTHTEGVSRSVWRGFVTVISLQITRPFYSIMLFISCPPRLRCADTGLRAAPRGRGDGGRRESVRRIAYRLQLLYTARADSAVCLYRQLCNCYSDPNLVELLLSVSDRDCMRLFLRLSFRLLYRMYEVYDAT